MPQAVLRAGNKGPVKESIQYPMTRVCIILINLIARNPSCRKEPVHCETKNLNSDLLVLSVGCDTFYTAPIYIYNAICFTVIARQCFPARGMMYFSHMMSAKLHSADDALGMEIFRSGWINRISIPSLCATSLASVSTSPSVASTAFVQSK